MRSIEIAPVRGNRNRNEKEKFSGDFGLSGIRGSWSNGVKDYVLWLE